MALLRWDTSDDKNNMDDKLTSGTVTLPVPARAGAAVDGGAGALARAAEPTASMPEPQRRSPLNLATRTLLGSSLRRAKWQFARHPMRPLRVSWLPDGSMIFWRAGLIRPRLLQTNRRRSNLSRSGSSPGLAVRFGSSAQR